MKTVDEKSNELVAILKLLKPLALKGLIIMMDAMGTPKENVQQIIADGAAYVLAVKDYLSCF